jgi:uroporphyrinogen decarboxylase
MKDLDRSGIADYPWWPKPDEFDYEDAERRAREAASEFAVIGPWVSLFEIYCQLRGLEQALMDLVLDPDLVDAILDYVEEIQTQMMRRLLSRAPGCFDLVFVSDDIAGQTGLLMSPASWRRHLEPRLKRWCDLIHDHGARVLYHTDGAAEPLVGPLIDTGIDVLNPIQHICPGMECGPLKQHYGSQVIFHGGIDNQHVLPFGTVDEVRRETLNCLETLGAGREGFICCSCHNVQAGTPIENILTMVETVQKS